MIAHWIKTGSKNSLTSSQIWKGSDCLRLSSCPSTNTVQMVKIQLLLPLRETSGHFNAKTKSRSRATRTASFSCRPQLLRQRVTASEKDKGSEAGRSISCDVTEEWESIWCYPSLNNTGQLERPKTYRGVAASGYFQQGSFQEHVYPLRSEKVLGLTQAVKTEQQSPSQNYKGGPGPKAGPQLLLHKQD